MKVNVGVGMVSHNRLHLTRRTLDALIRSCFIAGVIVDNASTDGTAEYVATLAGGDPRLTVIQNNQNLYPGAARNQIVCELLKFEVDVILFLDNDVIISDGCTAAIAEIFSISDLAQVSPLPVPQDFFLESLTVGEHRLALSIHNCNSAATAVRASLFEKGLRWRGIRWSPTANQEIGEDWYLSRDIKNRFGLRFAWFDESHPDCCTNLGRTAQELDRDLDYYVRTFADRGMLSLLEGQLPHRAQDLQSYRALHGVPELHQRFALTDLPAIDAMTEDQKREHRREYLDLLPTIRALQASADRTPQEDSLLGELAARVRNYFGRIDERHPLFGQRTLQATTFFNRVRLGLAAKGSSS